MHGGEQRSRTLYYTSESSIALCLSVLQAYHFFMLAQRELYSGSHETSLKIVQATHTKMYQPTHIFAAFIQKYMMGAHKLVLFLFPKALYLRDFEDLLPIYDLYCLLALSALMCGAYGVASKVVYEGGKYF